MYKFTDIDNIKQFLYSLEEKHNGKGTAVIIGNFDGCHSGHRFLIKSAVEFANANNILTLALSFDPHPKVFFARCKYNHLIFDTDQKSKALHELKVDIHAELKFDFSIASMSGEQFVHQILIESLYAKAVFVGSNFKFGANRSCDANKLKSITALYGVKTLIIEPLIDYHYQKFVSSTLIKALVMKNKIADVNRLLGHFFVIEGQVVKGMGLGGKINSPTANIDCFGNHELLSCGVFCGYVYISLKKEIYTYEADNNMKKINDNNKKTMLLTKDFLKKYHDNNFIIDDDFYKCVFYKGTRPSITNKLSDDCYIEVHIIDDRFKSSSFVDNHLTGKYLTIYLLDFIRSEMIFNSLSDLSGQIAKDIDKANKVLASIFLD